MGTRQPWEGDSLNKVTKPVGKPRPAPPTPKTQPVTKSRDRDWFGWARRLWRFACNGPVAPNVLHGVGERGSPARKSLADGLRRTRWDLKSAVVSGPTVYGNRVVEERERRASEMVRPRPERVVRAGPWGR